ncbi:MAG: type II 3-dehydroquinate dehydratase [Alphaproteobacteria bacterium]|nr:type II 3-dehydroquinate dehydratase [Alphaproteobacteria bacterium]MDE2110830.1 type II 3-dehydroquinate dehydratase [Alphaproteobacteria bacterium]MDE2495496.1 type II 3-dehydroquinate dehydratase [Alphaproteobacteria bacterium]
MAIKPVPDWLFASSLLPSIKPHPTLLTEPFVAKKSKTLPIYVLNGPNLNLLGRREPDIYGRTTLAEIEQMTVQRADTHGLSVVFRQSNHEGELIDWIQEARTKSTGVIINGGAYSHTSLALHDALRALDHPVVEVHLSNPFAREDFRHHSRLSPVAKGVIVGFGAQSYVLAIDAIASLIKGSAG